MTLLDIRSVHLAHALIRFTYSTIDFVFHSALQWSASEYNIIGKNMTLNNYLNGPNTLISHALNLIEQRHPHQLSQLLAPFATPEND